ncbi:MAG: MerR family DNA-binding transcriptional regulator [Rhodoferax sp.]
MNTSLSIAEAAKATGLSPYTLRYYEQIGLIAPVDRRGGARRYGDADMRTLGEALQCIRKKIRIYQDLQATPKRA